MTKRTTLLLDGDTIAFIAASACQHQLQSEDGTIETFFRIPEGEAVVDRKIQSLFDRLKATHIKVFLSAGSNWRFGVDPHYKSNRKDSVRPKGLGPMKDYLRSRYGAISVSGLEADDCIGIYLTNPELEDWGTRIAVGYDKDFNTIPGKHYQLKGDDTAGGTPAIRTVTPEQAYLTHLTQTLSGDAVDGIDGCPGIGKKRAAALVADPQRLVAREGVITRGKNKGQKTTRWTKAGPCSPWEAVVCAYQKAGLGEAEALVAARLTNILHHHQYNPESHAVTLWEPIKESSS